MGRMLGGFETILLFAVLELEDGAHGVTIRRAIEERTGRKSSPGAVHTALDRLERRGLVSSRAEGVPPKRGGRPRRFYRVTPEGAAILQQSHRAVTAMSAGLEGKLARAVGGPAGNGG